MGGTLSGQVRMAVLAAAVAALWGTPVLAQETVVVRVKLIQGEVPTDPLAPIWNTIPATEFPMSPQVHWPKRILQVTVKSIRVRGVHNTKQIAFLLEYADPTRDPADAAALEFMVGDKKAHFAHGQPMAQMEGGPVNIWYWKNKDAKVLDMNAKGFGTLKAQSQQDVTGKGVYRKGTWKVVFTRSLTTGDVDHDTQFKPGEFINIALAIWHVKKLESGDLKGKGSKNAVSCWLYFRGESSWD